MNSPAKTTSTDFHRENWASLRAHPLFDGLPDDQIREVLPHFQFVTLRPNELFIEEGLESSLDFYMILKGELEVIRKAYPDDNHLIHFVPGGEFVVARLTAGDAIGELSFIKGNPRSASIRSATHSMLLGISPDAFQQLETYHPTFANQLLKNMIGYVGERLKRTSANEVKALKIEIQNSILNSKANLFFSYVIGLLCIYNLTINTITTLSLDANRASVISAIIIIVFSGVLMLMIRQSQLPIYVFGLTSRNWWVSIKESMGWTLAIIAVLTLIKWTLIHQVPKYQHLPLFDFDFGAKRYMTFNFILYGLHSPIQEFIARGVLQGSLQHFFTGRNVTLRAIVISNALFSATHVHLMNGLLGLIVFVPGLFWGWLYSRHQNLIGVSLSHILVGWSALFFLNLESLF